MNITQITDSLQNLLNNFDKDQFIYQLLRAYNIPNASIERLKKGTHNLSKIEGEIDWKTKLFFKSYDPAQNLQEAMEALKADGKVFKHSPRFVVLTDFVNLLAFDTKMSETLDIQLLELVQHYDFFLPWAGMEKSVLKTEHPADVKAAEKMAKLYDEIKKENSTETHEEVHNLNVFLSRLLFCFFAEDTGIFPKSQLFTHDIQDHTDEDGKELNQYLDTLFEVMNTDLPQRDKSLAKNLAEFPYVNGGLFRNKHYSPIFTKRSRQMLIDSGEMNWADINPDIFGSMIQAVITPEHRGGMGMHYTSVPNIMKVIEPLFLDNLYEEFESAKGNIKKINDLLKRIWNIKIFDPACGSGNFLIIAYKKMRELEMAIFKEIDRINQTFTTQFTGISLDNFYGIELDDFAHEIAILSLWLAEHQMNQVFFKAFGRALPALPLKETGNIFQGNATRLDWEVVCPKKEQDEIYILGNPPYLGYSMQSKEQKDDLAIVFKGIKDYKNLDYIACWFLKGAKFIQNQNAQFSYVSTNSICQGEQVASLWTHIFQKNLEIGFAHTSFKWVNNAKANAGVIVAIVGIRNKSTQNKYIYANTIKKKALKISPYLLEIDDFIIQKRTFAISQIQPILRGSGSVDGGFLTLTFEEKEDLISKYSEADSFIKKYTGSNEFINGIQRYCLWIDEVDVDAALNIPEIKRRVEEVKKMRLSSTKQVTRESADTPYQFGEVRYRQSDSVILIPRVSSERREYIPFGFLDGDYVVSDSAQAIYDAKPWTFSFLSSRMHMTWIRAVAGRLKSDYRYSSSLCYNAFPFPPISDSQKDELKRHVFRILEEREHHSEKTLAQLYDPDKMPEGLREAHHQNDLAVERCYRSKPFESDEERLEYLFKMYEQMIEQEKTKGTLFEVEKKEKKRVKKS